VRRKTIEGKNENIFNRGNMLGIQAFTTVLKTKKGQEYALQV